MAYFVGWVMAFHNNDLNISVERRIFIDKSPQKNNMYAILIIKYLKTLQNYVEIWIIIWQQNFTRSFNQLICSKRKTYIWINFLLSLNYEFNHCQKITSFMSIPVFPPPLFFFVRHSENSNQINYTDLLGTRLQVRCKELLYRTGCLFH